MGDDISETLDEARKTMRDAIAAFNREIQLKGAPTDRTEVSARINFINVKTPSST
jgi:hypothetical protein